MVEERGGGWTVVSGNSLDPRKLSGVSDTPRARFQWSYVFWRAGYWTTGIFFFLLYLALNADPQVKKPDVRPPSRYARRRHTKEEDTAPKGLSVGGHFSSRCLFRRKKETEKRRTQRAGVSLDGWPSVSPPVIFSRSRAHREDEDGRWMVKISSLLAATK